jgi:MYXO-CTERM domain-containing protein
MNAGTIETFDLLVTEHEQVLIGLSKATKYYFRVSSADQVHNASSDDNGGQMYTFTTLACDPSCAGKQCGSDGCGGDCGHCAAGSTCNSTNGHCECPTSSTPGCGGCPCEAAVCAADPFCCNVAWDGDCAAKCLAQGGCAKTEVDAGTEGGALDGGSDVDANTIETGVDGSDGWAPETGLSDSSGAAGKGGAAGSDAQPGASGKAGAEDASTDAVDKGGDGVCGCRSAGSPRGSHAGWSALIALLLIAQRRRARKQR